MSLVMSLRSRGGSGSAARAGKVLTRFGATAGAMVRRLDRYDAISSSVAMNTAGHRFRAATKVAWSAAASSVIRSG